MKVWIEIVTDPDDPESAQKSAISKVILASTTSTDIDGMTVLEVDDSPDIKYHYGDIPDIELECNRCHHRWKPRSTDLPQVCPNPKCKSPYWNKTRSRSKKNQPEPANTA